MVEKVDKRREDIELNKQTYIQNAIDNIDQYKRVKGHEVTLYHQFRSCIQPTGCVYEEGTYGTILFDIKFNATMANAYFNAFGGAIAFAMDLVAVMGIYAFTRQWGVTLKFNIDFLNAVKLNKDLKGKVTVTKLSKKVAFVLVTLLDPENNNTALAQSSLVCMLTDNSQVKLEENSNFEEITQLN
eukprot:403337323